ncbi:hypothetical protein R1sor_013269 [Riccia sorocarpa]|uniref:Uncharacterized protein n=1 Tax=Riccia sorocarpa TaxID=122646 RepID=A0ABD3H9M2_9MARC
MLSNLIEMHILDEDSSSSSDIDLEMLDLLSTDDESGSLARPPRASSSTSPDRLQDLSSSTPDRVQDLTSSSPEGRQVSPDPKDIPSSSSPGRHQDRPDPTDIPSPSSPSSSPGRRKQASPTRAERQHSSESSPGDA